MKYSILIPAYKGKFFHECLESVLNQTFSDYEVVILNDASPEDLKSIVDSFNNPRTRYYCNEKNVGAINVVYNWNKLLSLAKGDFVVCIGDDDKLAPNFLEAYNELMEKYPDLDVYHARTEIIDENSEFLNLQEDRPDRESVYAMMWNCMFKNRIQFIGDFLFRTETLRSYGGFYYLPMAWSSDYITTFMVGEKKGFANLHQPTFYYRSNRLSITTSKNEPLKVKAMQKAAEWECNLLAKPVSSEMDEKYRKLITTGLTQHLHRSLLISIGADIKSQFFRQSLYWIKNRKEYSFSLKEILASIGIAVAFKLNIIS